MLRLRNHPWILPATGALSAAALSVAVLGLGLASPALAAGPSASAPASPSPSATRSSTLTASAAAVPNGSTITFTYSTPAATGSATNWIGIYEPGHPGGEPALAAAGGDLTPPPR